MVRKIILFLHRSARSWSIQMVVKDFRTNGPLQMPRTSLRDKHSRHRTAIPTLLLCLVTLTLPRLHSERFTVAAVNGTPELKKW